MRTLLFALHLGKPHATRRGVDHWCVIGAANLRVAYSRADSAELIRTTVRGQSVHGVGPGDRYRRAKVGLHLTRRFNIGHTDVLEASGHHGSRLFAGIRRGGVHWLALAAARLSDSRARADLVRAR